MVESDEIAQFMGRINAQVESLNGKLDDRFIQMNKRLDKGEKRFDELDKKVSCQGDQLKQIFTSLWVGRTLVVIGAAAIAWITGVAEQIMSLGRH